MGSSMYIYAVSTVEIIILMVTASEQISTNYRLR